MKVMLIILSIFFIAGCSYEGKNVKSYLEEPRWFIKDPHYAAYQDKQQKLESKFLSKEITYAEYIRQKEGLEETYAKEVQERNQKISPTAY